MSQPDDALLKIGQSTMEAASGVLEVLCPEEGQVTRGLVSEVPSGAHPMDGIFVPSIATSVSYVDGVTGGNVFLMTIKGARRLAASMMGEPLPEDDGDLSEIEESAIGEAMNQMMSAAAMATTKLLGKEVEIAPPEVHRFEAVEQAREAYDATPHAVTTTLWVLGEPCRLIQLVPHAFIVRMNRALSELTTEYASEHTGAPLSQSVRTVPLRLWAELGRVRMPLSRLIGLPVGAVVELDREVEEPIDLYVDDMRFATGRLLVTDDDEWAVRIETVHGVPASPTPIEMSTTAEGD